MTLYRSPHSPDASYPFRLEHSAAGYAGPGRTPLATVLFTASSQQHLVRVCDCARFGVQRESQSSISLHLNCYIGKMVATRSHPRGDFPTTEPSPTKRSARSRTSTESPAPASPDYNASTARSLARRAVSNTIAVVTPPSPSEINEAGWCHSVSNITVFWLSVSIPLVLWDSLYILLRPHTMKGGALQWPIWKPYEIYAAIDHVYGQPGWDNKDGFGGAQGVLNAVELVLYGLYAMIIYNHSRPAAAGTGLQVGKGVGAWFAGGRKVRGTVGNRALIIGFAAAIMTLSKTVLYCKCTL